MFLHDYKGSEAEVELSDHQLKKLESIRSPELVFVVNEMKKSKKAGYQESLMEVMIEDLQK